MYGMMFFAAIMMIIILFFVYKIEKLNIKKNSQNNNGNSQSKRVDETQYRRSIPCYFSDGIRYIDFEQIVKKNAKLIKRIIRVEVHQTDVIGTAISQSGLSDWRFLIDFNDYGHLTGRYWTSTDNLDSNIEQILAKRISEEIIARKV